MVTKKKKTIKKKGKSKAGRPTVMTEITLQKLQDGFLMGLTDRECCLYAGISTRTLFDYIDRNPKYSQQKELWKDQPKIHAKMAINYALKPVVNKKTGAIREYGAIGIATRYAEKKMSNEFSGRTVVDNQGSMKYETTKKVELSDKSNKLLESLLSKSKTGRSSKKRLTKTGKKSKKS